MSRNGAERLDSIHGWLRETPKNWELRPLKALGRLIAGSAFPEALQGVEDAELPFYKVKDLGSSADGRHLAGTDNTVSEETAEALRARIVPANAIVYAKIGAALMLNRRRVTTKDACIDNNMSAFVPDPWVLTPEWAYYVLSSLDFGEFVNPGAVPSLSEGDQGVLVLPVPDIRKQEAIAGHLDHETARIDKLIAMQESLIERLDEYRTALITRVVTKGLPPEAAEAAGLDPEPALKDSGVEWLGEVPKHWAVSHLRRFVTWMKTGTTPTSAELSESAGDDIAWLSPGDIGSALQMKPPSRTLANRAIVDGLVPLFPAESTVIVGIGATAGRVGHTAQLSTGNQQLTCIVSNDRVVPRFLSWQLWAQTEALRAIAPFATLPILNNEFLLSLPFTAPSPREQRAIVVCLDAAVDRIDAVCAKADSSIERLLEYRSALISAAVTGKIDVREAALVGGGV